MLSGVAVRVPLPAGQHQLVYEYSAPFHVPYVNASLHTPTKVEQSIIAYLVDRTSQWFLRRSGYNSIDGRLPAAQRRQPRRGCALMPVCIQPHLLVVGASMPIAVPSCQARLEAKRGENQQLRSVRSATIRKLGTEGS
jgi:hypothetical protein